LNLNSNLLLMVRLVWIIGSRQTFMTTYLFLPEPGYLGNSAGNFAARIESGDSSLLKRVNKVWDLLGGIEVSVYDAKGKMDKSGRNKGDGAHRHPIYI